MHLSDTIEEQTQCSASMQIFLLRVTDPLDFAMQPYTTSLHGALSHSHGAAPVTDNSLAGRILKKPLLFFQHNQW